jgi:hypothetical protein
MRARGFSNYDASIANRATRFGGCRDVLRRAGMRSPRRVGAICSLANDDSVQLLVGHISHELLQFVIREANYDRGKIAEVVIENEGWNGDEETAGGRHQHLADGLRELGGITDAGLAKIATLSNLSEILVGKTQITDAGLAKLTALTSLKKLGLRETKVTDAGIAAFKKALPKCEVSK